MVHLIQLIPHPNNLLPELLHGRQNQLVYKAGVFGDVIEVVPVVVVGLWWGRELLVVGVVVLLLLLLLLLLGKVLIVVHLFGIESFLARIWTFR